MTPASDFVAGDDVPDPVARLVASGYYDGILDGALETRAGRSYRFAFVDETTAFVRSFLLSPLPDGSVARLAELIAPHSGPPVPYWVPSWWHLPADEKAALDRQVDAILAATGPPIWAVAGQFLTGEGLRVRPGPWTAAELTRGERETGWWSAVFGLPGRSA